LDGFAAKHPSGVAAVSESPGVIGGPQSVAEGVREERFGIRVHRLHPEHEHREFIPAAIGPQALGFQKFGEAIDGMQEMERGGRLRSRSFAESVEPVVWEHWAVRGL
jgi:hypothetical protein